MFVCQHAYLVEDYSSVRALAQSDLVLVHVGGMTAGQPRSTHGAQPMIARAGSPRWTGQREASCISPHVGHRFDRSYWRHYQGYRWRRG
jgi:hypothetical protein